jgi:hypothetical protein
MSKKIPSISTIILIITLCIALTKGQLEYEYDGYLETSKPAHFILRKTISVWP